MLLTCVIFTANDDAVNSANEDGELQCHVTYGDVIDKVARKNISICQGQDGQGLSHRVYVSQSNVLHIIFNTPATASTQRHQHNFIIHVEGERFKLGKLESFSLTYNLLSSYFLSFLRSSPPLPSSVHVLALFPRFFFVFLTVSFNLSRPFKGL